MTPFMGVRISWLILAKNSDFARFAASASSLEIRNCSESARSSSSRLCAMVMSRNVSTMPPRGRRRALSSTMTPSFWRRMTQNSSPALSVASHFSKYSSTLLNSYMPWRMPISINGRMSLPIAQADFDSPDMRHAFSLISMMVKLSSITTTPWAIDSSTSARSCVLCSMSSVR